MKPGAETNAGHTCGHITICGSQEFAGTGFTNFVPLIEALFIISRIKPVYKSASLKLIDER